MKRKPPIYNIRRVVHINKNWRGVTINNVFELVQFESFQELILILILLRDLSVARFVSQPFTIIFRIAHKKNRYTPDFLVELKDGTVIIREVTVAKRRSQQRHQHRMDAMEEHCRNRHWQYIVDDETTLPDKTEVANLIGLHGFEARCYLDEEIRFEVLRYLSEQPTTASVEEIIDHVYEILLKHELLIRQTICHLLWWHELKTDMNRLLFKDGFLSNTACVWI